LQSYHVEIIRLMVSGLGGQTFPKTTTRLMKSA
jgi:hypothetical protein